MTKTFRFLFLILAALNISNACGQKSKSEEKIKCKLVYDTDTGMDLYINITSYPEPLDTNFNDINFFTSTFEVPKKNYDDKLKIKFIWLITKDGKCEFFKLAFTANDKEIEAEARRVVGLLPKYTPAKCGQEPVICKKDFETSIGSLKKAK